MRNYRTARIIPVAVILIIAALLIAVLFSIARVIFFPNSVADVSQINTGHTSLISSTAGRSVKMTVRGPIISDEEFRSYQISVSPNQRHLTTYQGYMGTVLETVTLPNSIPAYKEFIYALDNYGMMDGTELKGDQNDRTGDCPTGYIYEFGIYNDGKLVKELWSSSCNAYHGSLSVKSKPIRTIFISQLPTAETITKKLWR